jgi:glutathione S-transferase
MKLVIGNKNYSSWSLRPWLLMTHYQLTFTEQRIKLFADDMKEKMSGVCPNFKVPVLVEESINNINNSKLTVWDSLAICEYINEKYLAGKAWPSNLEQRAKARSICAEMHGGFFSLRDELPMNCRRKISSLKVTNNTQADINRIIELWQQCLSKNSNTTKSTFLFGDFSIADAYYMPIVARFNSYQIEVPTLVRRYMDTMLALPAYQQWYEAAKQENEVIDCEEK